MLRSFLLHVILFLKGAILESRKEWELLWNHLKLHWPYSYEWDSLLRISFLLLHLQKVRTLGEAEKLIAGTSWEVCFCFSNTWGGLTLSLHSVIPLCRLRESYVKPRSEHARKIPYLLHYYPSPKFRVMIVLSFPGTP